MTNVADLELNWRSRLSQESSELSQQALEEIICWLLGETRFESLDSLELATAQRAMEYRYQILRQRYLGASPTQAYRNLINRLGTLAVLRQKVGTWVALSRDRKRAVTTVLEEVIQEMLNRDRTIQQQMTWIAQCTQDKRLRERLLLTSIEEYCLRPIRNQPLIVYRFVNYLRRQGREGMTQVPRQEIVHLVSEEIDVEEFDGGSRFDALAIANYQEAQEWEQKQALRLAVQQSFEQYLTDRVSEVAARWLKLYLQGHSPEAIASILDLPINQVYRLREKVAYHALRVFALKEKPELVASWLEVSLEHNLGLTPKQWQEYWQRLTPLQRQLIQSLKTGQSLAAISQEMNLKISKVLNEWSKLYQDAQSLRNTAVNC